MRGEEKRERFKLFFLPFISICIRRFRSIGGVSAAPSRCCICKCFLQQRAFAALFAGGVVREGAVPWLELEQQPNVFSSSYYSSSSSSVRATGQNKQKKKKPPKKKSNIYY